MEPLPFDLIDADQPLLVEYFSPSRGVGRGSSDRPFADYLAAFAAENAAAAQASAHLAELNQAHLLIYSDLALRFRQALLDARSSEERVVLVDLADPETRVWEDALRRSHQPRPQRADETCSTDPDEKEIAL